MRPRLDNSPHQKDIPPTNAATQPPRNKLSNLQYLATLANDLPFSVPNAHVLEGQHFHRAIENILPGPGDALLPETLQPDFAAGLRQSLLVQPLPAETVATLRSIYEAFREHHDASTLCVRSCFDLEDLERQSFAGAFETVHGVTSFESLCAAVQVVYASVFSAPALSQLQRLSLERLPAMSVAIQNMIGGTGWLGGVAHTQAPDLRPHPLMLISVAENSAAVTSGSSIPEDYLVHRDNLATPGRRVVVQRQPGTHTNGGFTLDEERIRAIATALLDLEARFESPLEVEWLLDPEGVLHLLQARTAPPSAPSCTTPTPSSQHHAIAQGLPVGHGAVTGTIVYVHDLSQASSLPPRAIVVTDNTDPEWLPVIERASGIVTRIGARTSHVSRTARELGVLAVVGCGDAINALREGSTVTLICAEGLLGAVYQGQVETTSVLGEADEVSIRHVAEAFSLSRSCRPQHVHLDPSDMLTAFRLPPPGTKTHDLPTRMRRRIAGHSSVDDFVQRKLVEAACLVAVAFPGSKISLSLPATSPWHEALPTVARTCALEHGVTISLPR